MNQLYEILHFMRISYRKCIFVKVWNDDNIQREDHDN